MCAPPPAPPRRGPHARVCRARLRVCASWERRLQSPWLLVGDVCDERRVTGRCSPQTRAWPGRSENIKRGPGVA